ncbi:MAG: nucleotidyltransferase [Candidatus Thermoplasmatota archaeon]|nr:nucleotidyltransferase [Candidatus Thermoplasmatota archaeon]MBS3790589.1 nucleotidyltransferase [Candidatus Thermoplasmatota archaeon]
MIGEEEQKRILAELSEIFSEEDLNILVLGSIAVHYRLGPVGKTKDIDVRPFPIDDDSFEEYWDKLEAIKERIDGSLNIEIGGSTATLIASLEGKEVTIEVIDAGGEKFLTREVIDDMIDRSEEIEGVYVPSVEHIVVTKAEAHLDRTEKDPSKEKFRQDLVNIRKLLKKKELELASEEIERIVDLRVERKRDQLLTVVKRYLHEVMTEDG